VEDKNIIELFVNVANSQPYATAFYFPSPYKQDNTTALLTYSFHQLLRLCKEYAYGLISNGIKEQQRVLMLFKPNIHFVAITYALLTIGAVPVFIDPGMSLSSLIKCIKKVEPDAIIANRAAMLLRYIYPSSFYSVKTTILAENNGMLGSIGLNKLRESSHKNMPLMKVSHDGTAVIAFTSGSTGVPKGVIYTHNNFIVMLELLQKELGIKKGNIDLPGLYIFALLNPPLGVTTVMPEMDITKPAQLNPESYVNTIETIGVTTSFGSPTIWNKVSDYCIEKNIELHSIQRIFIAGASVPPNLLKKLSKIAPEAEVFTPYGATEGLPLTNVSAKEILTLCEKTDRGEGFCVGRPVTQHEIKIIRITDDPIPHWSEDLEVQNGVVGEICVKGGVVTNSYFKDEYHNRLTKIQDKNGFWHRMGDLGYYDQEQRLWICGRKSHRVETKNGTLYPDMVEAIFNQHPEVSRSALVGIGDKGNQKAVIIIEPKKKVYIKDRKMQEQLIRELLLIGQKSKTSSVIKEFLFHPNFPVDIRHNAKIQRDKLAVWCEKRLGVKQNN